MLRLRHISFRGRLLHIWAGLRASLWFVPGLMAAGAIAFALIILEVDELLPPEWASKMGWIYSRSATGARDLLSTVAASMITVAGLAFSIIVVALQLASSQFGPRVLRNFMRDTGTQVVLGTFIATFLYCIMVMRTIADDGSGASPRLAVTVAVALSMASLAVLIYFLHHTASSIHAPHVIAEVARELRSGTDRMYPQMLGDGAPEPPLPTHLAGPRGIVSSSRSGYLQGVDGDSLMRIACAEDLLLWLQVRPGNFVIEGSPLLFVYPSERLTSDLASELRGACIIGGQRTPEQDVEFTIEQLVQIASRALSGSFNDPFTAKACVDHLHAGLDRLLQRRMPPAVRVDDEGTPRVVAQRIEVAALVNTALLPVQESSHRSPLVMVRLLEIIDALIDRAPTRDTLRVLRAQADAVAQHAQSIGSEYSRHEMERLHRRIVERLDAAR